MVGVHIYIQDPTKNFSQLGIDFFYLRNFLCYLSLFASFSLSTIIRLCSIYCSIPIRPLTKSLGRVILYIDRIRLNMYNWYGGINYICKEVHLEDESGNDKYLHSSHKLFFYLCFSGKKCNPIRFTVRYRDVDKLIKTILEARDKYEKAYYNETFFRYDEDVNLIEFKILKSICLIDD